MLKSRDVSKFFTEDLGYKKKSSAFELFVWIWGKYGFFLKLGQEMVKNVKFCLNLAKNGKKFERFA